MSAPATLPISRIVLSTPSEKRLLPEVLGERFFQEIKSNHIDKAYEFVCSDNKSRLSKQLFERTWKGLIGSAGPIKSWKLLERQSKKQIVGQGTEWVVSMAYSVDCSNGRTVIVTLIVTTRPIDGTCITDIQLKTS